MRTKLVLLLAFLFALVANAETVYFDLAVPYFNANPATNRVVTLQPLSPFPGNFLRYTSSVSGTFYASNLYIGDYAGVVLQKGQAGQIPFQITVVSNGTTVVNAHEITSVLGQQSYPISGKSSWSINASDQRYLRTASVGSTDYVSPGQSTSVRTNGTVFSVDVTGSLTNNAATATFATNASNSTNLFGVAYNSGATNLTSTNTVLKGTTEFRTPDGNDIITADFINDDDNHLLSFDFSPGSSVQIGGTGVVAVAHYGAGGALTYTGSGNNGTLATSVDTLQELNNAVDDLVVHGSNNITAGTISSNKMDATAYAAFMGADVVTNHPTSPIIEFDFSERGGQLIHNKAERVAPFYSITKPPQGWYAIGGSGTISDSSRSNAFLNPFGDPTATWCNWTGAAQSYLNAGTIVVPRTNLYTASVWVRSNSQTNETWRMNIGGGYTTNFTAYTNWQRFSYPIGLSAGSQNFLPVATTGSSATANLLAWGAQLEAGTMTAVPDWHWDACLGSSPSVETADPAWTNRWLKFSGSQYATLSGVSPLKLQAATVYAVVRFTSSANQNVILATYQQDYQFALGGLAGFKFGAAEATPGSYANWYDNRWHVIAGTSSGTNTLLYIDDIEQTSNYTANGISPLELDKLLLGTVLNGVYLNADLAYLAVHDVAVSRTDYLADLASLQARMFPRVSVSNSSAVVFWEGDSITTSDYSSSFAIRAMTNFSGVRSRNFSVSSSHLASGVEPYTLTNRWPHINALRGLSGTNVLIFLVGANDLLVDSAAQLINETSNYCVTARSAGFKVIPGTVISRTALTNSVRELYNTMLRTNTWYDALADYATNSVMGCDGCSTNLTYFLDGTHPTVAGNTNLTPIAVQALQSIGL